MPDPAAHDAAHPERLVQDDHVREHAGRQDATVVTPSSSRALRLDAARGRGQVEPGRDHVAHGGVEGDDRSGERVGARERAAVLVDLDVHPGEHRPTGARAGERQRVADEHQPGPAAWRAG